MDERFDQPLPEACPPDTATSRTQEAFRIVTSSPPTAGDFLTHAQKGIAQNADPCRRTGISVFATYETAIHQQQLCPRLGKFIAKGQLTPDHGCISPPSPTGHMDWWAFASAVNPEEFTVVENGN